MHRKLDSRMKKKFIPPFETCSLVVSPRKLYILVQQIGNCGQVQYDTYPIERISKGDITDVEYRKGILIRDELRDWVQAGGNVKDFDLSKARPVDAANCISEVLEFALQKTELYSHATRLSYASDIRILIAFVERMGWAGLPVYEFDKVKAVQYLDYYRYERKVCNNTWNNVLASCVRLFNFLIDRGKFLENPFKSIKKLPKSEKKRRCFTNEEMNTIIKHAYDNDRILFYSMLLQYACLVRPTEQRKLRFLDIDTKIGIISINWKQSKVDKSRYATIPNQYLHFFKESFFKLFPKDYIIFGHKVYPHKDKSCGKNSLYERQRKLLRELQSKGLISNIKGLQFYSWKDTGITDMIREVGLMPTVDQAGHTSPNTTLKYRHKSPIIKQMQGFKGNIEIQNS